MANGQQIADENVEKFNAWAVSRTDEDFQAMVIRGVLSRSEIAAECSFAKSALTQNPRVRAALKLLEDALRTRGVLPPAAVEDTNDPPALPMRQPNGVSAARDAERLKRLEEDNASLKAEVSELKRLISRYEVLQDALAETGRLPR